MEYLKEQGKDLYIRGRCHPNVILHFLQVSEIVTIRFLVELYARAHFDIDIYVEGRYVQPLRHEIEEVPFTYSVPLNFPGSKIEIYLSNLCSWEIESIEGRFEFCGDCDDCRNKTDSKNNLLILGDSISQGMETDAPSLTYSNLLYRNMGYRILNQSIGGMQFDPKFLELVPELDCHKIIVMLGTNDILKGEDIMAIKARMDAYFQLLISRFSRRDIIVISPIHLPEIVGNIKIREEVIREQIRRNTDFHGLTMIDGRWFFPQSSHFYYDEIHPNEIGNFLMYDFMKEFL